MHRGTVTQGTGDGGLEDRTKSEVRYQNAEGMNAEWMPGASQEPGVKAQEAKHVLVQRPGDG